MLVLCTVLVDLLEVFTQEPFDFFCNCRVDVIEEAPGLAAMDSALAVVEDVFTKDIIQLVEYVCAVSSSSISICDGGVISLADTVAGHMKHVLATKTVAMNNNNAFFIWILLLF